MRFNDNGDAELDTFDEYTLDSFARGWDNVARSFGNKRATRRAPIPGTVNEYYRGQSACRRIMRFLGRGKNNA